MLLQKAVKSTNKKVVKRPYVKKAVVAPKEEGGGFFKFIREFFGLND